MNFLLQVALEGEADAAMQAIARTAKHRLERGIWTSPGAGLYLARPVFLEHLLPLRCSVCAWVCFQSMHAHWHWEVLLTSIV